MAATFAWTFRNHCTAHQRTSCIEAAGGIADDPTMLKPTGISRSLLRFHHQHDGTQLVLTGMQAVAMTTLQDEKTVALVQKPSTWRWRIVEFNTIQ
jgi:hypothetical protein